MLSKAEIEARLKSLGCTYLLDADDLHEVWMTLWGDTFWIPMAGPHCPGLDADHWADIEADIERSRP